MENVNFSVLDYIVKDINLSVSRLGINTELSIVEAKDYANRPYLKVDGTPFQTTPMIFKTIKLDGSIHIQETRAGQDALIMVVIRLSYRYQTFDDGSNGHQLGEFKFTVDKRCWDKWDGKDTTFAKYEIQKVQGLAI